MERRLAAILAADVVGYSWLIRDDEEGTIAALKQMCSARLAEDQGTELTVDGAEGVVRMSANMCLSA